MELKELTTGSWFGDLLEEVLSALTPNPEEIEVDGTPEEMARKASHAAFMVSMGASIPGGPIGLAMIIPELLALTRLQIALIYKMAKFHNRDANVNRALILAIFGSALGVVVKHAVIGEIGARVVVKNLTAEGSRALSRSIGAKIGSSLLRKGAVRWLPFVIAPLFGYFSLSLTKRIGREAAVLFCREIEIEGVGGPADPTAFY